MKDYSTEKEPYNVQRLKYTNRLVLNYTAHTE